MDIVINPIRTKPTEHQTYNHSQAQPRIMSFYDTIQQT